MRPYRSLYPLLNFIPISQLSYTSTLPVSKYFHERMFTMDIKISTILLTLPVILNGCASTSKSVLLGSAIGGAVGGMIGQDQSHNSQGTAVGLAIGAGLGSLVGYLAHKDKQKAADKLEPKPQSDEYNFPALTRPKLKSVWVPDKIEGNKYIKGHWIYVIEDAGSWSKD